MQRPTEGIMSVKSCNRCGVNAAAYFRKHTYGAAVFRSGSVSWGISHIIVTDVLFLKTFTVILCVRSISRNPNKNRNKNAKENATTYFKSSLTIEYPLLCRLTCIVVPGVFSRRCFTWCDTLNPRATRHMPSGIYM